MRLWVVMCKLSNNKWEICDFTGFDYACTDYYHAHYFKRKLQEYLRKHGHYTWYKNRFKVVEFIQRYDVK